MKRADAFRQIAAFREEDAKWDKLLAELVTEKIESMPTPSQLSIEEGLHKLEERVKQEKKERKNQRVKLSVAAALLFVVFFSTIWTPPATQAFDKLYEAFHVVQDSVLQIFIGGSPGPEGDHNYPVNIEQTEYFEAHVSIEEAQILLPFRILQPTYMPEKYQLEQVRVVTSTENESFEVLLIYQNGKKSIHISQKSMGEESALGAIFDNRSLIEQLSIHGFPATIVTHEDYNSFQIIWTYHGQYIFIEGKVPKEELLKIAESIS